MEDRRQRENGEEICYKLVFVRGKGVADALQKMAEQRQDRGKNELVCLTSRLCFVQTDKILIKRRCGMMLSE